MYDVMGFTVGGGPGGLPFPMLNALSTPYRVFQGITDPGEIQDVPLGDRTQPVHATATIKPRTDATGLRSVRVINPDDGETLYLDYRSGGGKDAGSVYASNGALNSPSGLLHYAPGVVITAAHPGVGTNAGGVDDLVLDAAGHTSLPATGTWTNASGTLSVHVTAVDPDHRRGGQCRLHAAGTPARHRALHDGRHAGHRRHRHRGRLGLAEPRQLGPDPHHDDDPVDGQREPGAGHR